MTLTIAASAAGSRDGSVTNSDYFVTHWGDATNTTCGYNGGTGQFKFEFDVGDGYTCVPYSSNQKLTNSPWAATGNTRYRNLTGGSLTANASNVTLEFFGNFSTAARNYHLGLVDTTANAGVCKIIYNNAGAQDQNGAALSFWNSTPAIDVKVYAVVVYVKNTGKCDLAFYSNQNVYLGGKNNTDPLAGTKAFIGGAISYGGANSVIDIDELIVYVGNGITSGRPGSPVVLTFNAPTPDNGQRNNTQIIINMSAQSGNYLLWFGNSSALNQTAVVLNASAAATDIHNVTGTIVTKGTRSGNYSFLTSDNGTYMNITESVGTPGMNVTLNISPVDGAAGYIIMNGFYSTPGAGTIDLFVFDHLNDSWGYLRSFVKNTTDGNYNISLLPKHTSNDLLLQFVSAQTGNVNAFLALDQFVFEEQETTAYRTYITDVSPGTYFFKASADNGISNTTVRNWTLDNVNPNVAVGSFSVNVNTFINLTLNATDTHLFSYNISCPGLFNDTATGFDEATFNLNYSVNVTTSSVCSYQVCDGHTAQTIDALAVTKNASAVEFRFGSKDKTELSVKEASLTTATQKDRITFTATQNSIQAKGYAGNYYYTFTLKTGPNAVYIPSLTYPGWIVDGDSKIWTDFKTDTGESVAVFQTFPGVWEISVTSKKEVLTFYSTGSLNCASGSFSITANPVITPYWQLGQCRIMTQVDVLASLFLFIVTAGGYLLSKKVGIPIVGAFFGFAFMAMGLSLWGCSLILGWSIVMLGLSIFMVEVFVQRR